MREMQQHPDSRDSDSAADNNRQLSSGGLSLTAAKEVGELTSKAPSNTLEHPAQSGQNEPIPINFIFGSEVSRFKEARDHLTQSKEIGRQLDASRMEREILIWGTVFFAFVGGSTAGEFLFSGAAHSSVAIGGGLLLAVFTLIAYSHRELRNQRLSYRVDSDNKSRESD